MKLTSDGHVTGLTQGALLNGKRAGERRNGRPVGTLYVYRGERTLEAELPIECAAGCGRRSDTKIPGGEPWTCTECRPGPGR